MILKKLAKSSIFCILIFLSVNLVDAQQMKSVPYVDPEIYVQLERHPYVSILAISIDDSNIRYGASESSRSRTEKDVLRMAYFKNKTTEMLLKIPNTNLIDREVLIAGDGFAGNISREGLEQLINNNTYVSEIHYNRPFRVQLDQSGPMIHSPTIHVSGLNGTGQTICIIDT